VRQRPKKSKTTLVRPKRDSHNTMQQDYATGNVGEREREREKEIERERERERE
jgi:hypothetical protein